jgi:hypothetical protein
MSDNLHVLTEQAKSIGAASEQPSGRQTRLEGAQMAGPVGWEFRTPKT